MRWIGAVLLLVLLGCERPAAPEATRPNIVFILIDDLGWADLPAYGHAFHETPHIDRMVAEGMRFTDAYAATPVCSPTRASIQSGQYPARIGMTDFIPGHWRPYERVTVPINRTQHLPAETITIGEAMQSAGYTTGYFGKWHLGGAPEHQPTAQGYDHALVHAGWGQYDLARKLIPRAPDIDPNAYLVDVLTDSTTAFIAEHADAEQPFFVTLAHFAVHIPLEADSAKIAKYTQKPKPDDKVNNPIYAAMIEHVDESVGAVLDALDAHGLAETTVVVLYSDNGGLVERFDQADGVIVSTNEPLRNEKGSLYEGGIRVPFIARWPGQIAAGRTEPALMTSPDLFPTFVDLAEGALPETQPLDGISLVPYLTGQEVTEEDQTIFFHYPHYHHANPAGVVRRGRYKLLHDYAEDRLELYDLRNDIGETTNLADSLGYLVDELNTALEAWRAEVGAEMPTLNPDFDATRRGEWGRHPSRR